MLWILPVVAALSGLLLGVICVVVFLQNSIDLQKNLGLKERHVELKRLKHWRERAGPKPLESDESEEEGSEWNPSQPRTRLWKGDGGDTDGMGESRRRMTQEKSRSISQSSDSRNCFQVSCCASPHFSQSARRPTVTNTVCSLQMSGFFSSRLFF